MTTLSTTHDLQSLLERVEAHGFWVGRGERAKLCWQINGEFVSDRALRQWVYHNMDGRIDRYVGTCVLQMHVDAYAKRVLISQEQSHA
jgi:hypothetical protein